MEPLSVISDKDIFDEPSVEPKFYKQRPTVKGIVVDDDGSIAMLTVRGHSLFPGGGVENREVLEDALIRECMEEIGCKVMPITYVGRFDQYRARTAKKYEIHFFIAVIVGEKGLPTTTEEGELKCVRTWEKKSDVLSMLENQISEIPLYEYATQFNARTHLLAYQEFLKIKPLQ